MSSDLPLGLPKGLFPAGVHVKIDFKNDIQKTISLSMFCTEQKNISFYLNFPIFDLKMIFRTPTRCRWYRSISDYSCLEKTTQLHFEERKCRRSVDHQRSCETVLWDPRVGCSWHMTRGFLSCPGENFPLQSLDRIRAKSDHGYLYPRFEEYRRLWAAGLAVSHVTRGPWTL